MSIYPNPVRSEIHIGLSSADKYQITVTDLQGKTLLQKNNQSMIDLSGLENGIYLLTIRKGGLSQTQKILKW
jgi:aminopeptidase YwaD